MDRLKLAAKIAKVAGDKVRDKYFNKLATFQVKNDHSPVTKADFESNRIIISAIKKEFPGDDIVSEETRHPVKGAEFCWYIDPVDGTTNFVMGLDLWGVSVGITRQGKPFAGAIYLPPQKQLFTAQSGKGAFLNGKHLRTKRRRLPFVASIIRSRSPKMRKKALWAYSKLIRKPITIRILGSATVELVLIAQGKTDFCLSFARHPWDNAAGFVIAKEAGVVFFKLGKGTDPLVGEDLFATSPDMMKTAKKVLGIAK
ncbi:MAG: inositol monophosphatase [Nanoarchaeota archaeon]